MRALTLFFRRYLWLGLAMLGLLAGWLLLRNARPLEPAYQGRTVRQWMRRHPREYVPAMQAIGTNAIPFLLRELMASDNSLKRWGEERFRRMLDIPPPWETARSRQYHGFLALQILGSNAVPAMLEAVFQAPRRAGDEDRIWAIASALAGMGSPAEARSVMATALQSADLTRRTYAAGMYADLDVSRRLIQLTTSEDPVQRAAATRALIIWRTNEVEVVPALISRLDDEHAAVRRVAIDALAGRKTNAVAALPALAAAYTNEWVRPRRTNDVDRLYRGHAISINEVRWAIRWAIGEIQPTARPAWSDTRPPGLDHH